MTRPKAYITRRIPQPAIDIVAAAGDYTIWDSKDQAVPHIGSATVTARTRMATIAATNLVAALTGQSAPHPINPEVLEQ